MKESSLEENIIADFLYKVKVNKVLSGTKGLSNIFENYFLGLVHKN